jgi:hypothetical protein
LQLSSPKITNLSWGKIEIDGSQIFKDVKLFPGGCRKWDWRETGTQHSPGIQYSDAHELVDNGAEEIILTRGILGRLKVQKETIKKLELDGIIIHVLRTKESVKLYNNLIKDKKVGALIHTTC